MTSLESMWESIKTLSAAVISLIMGLLMATGGIMTARESAWNTLFTPFGLFMATCSIVALWQRLGTPRAIVTVQGDGYTSMPIWRTYLYGALATGFMLTVFATWGLVTALIVDSVWWPWSLAVALTLLLTGRIIQCLHDRPALTMTAAGIHYRGPGIDRYLAWDDIATTGVRQAEFGRALAITATPGATSYLHSKRRRVAQYENKAPSGVIEISAMGRKDDPLVRVFLPLLRQYVDSPGLRTEIGTARFVDRLHLFENDTARQLASDGATRPGASEVHPVAFAASESRWARAKRQWKIQVIYRLLAVAACALFIVALVEADSDNPFAVVMFMGSIWLWLGAAELVNSTFIHRAPYMKSQLKDGAYIITLGRFLYAHMAFSCALGLTIAAVGWRIAHLGGAPDWPWQAATVALIAIAVELGRVVRRRPTLTFTADGAHYRGPRIEAFLGWRDVRDITVRSDPYSASIVLEGYPNPSSWRWEHTSWTSSSRPTPTDKRISVRFPGSTESLINARIAFYANMYHRSVDRRAAVARRVDTYPPTGPGAEPTGS